MGVFLELFGVVFPLFKKDLIIYFCSLFTVHWSVLWNSPCKVAMCSRAVFHFTFYIQRWLCKQVTWTIKFPRHKLDQIALLLRLWYATFCICCQCSAKLMHAANVGFTSCPESVLMTLVWALLMCCNYWDQCRHDSWASASMFTLSCGLIPPPVNSSLSAREETLTAGVMFIRKYVTCQDLVWPVTLE